MKSIATASWDHTKSWTCFTFPPKSLNLTPILCDDIFNDMINLLSSLWTLYLATVTHLEQTTYKSALFLRFRITKLYLFQTGRRMGGINWVNRPGKHSPQLNGTSMGKEIGGDNCLLWNMMLRKGLATQLKFGELHSPLSHKFTSTLLLSLKFSSNLNNETLHTFASVP